MLNKNNKNCVCKETKKLNRKIRELFVREIDKVKLKNYRGVCKGEDVVKYNCDRYKNKLKNGYNVVWKSMVLADNREKEYKNKLMVVWKNIIKKIGKGWEYREFDGRVGMYKLYV